MKCKNCGGINWTVVNRMGAIETWRCLECSKEELVHVNAPLSAEEFAYSSEPVFRLIAEWSSIPAAKDVESLRFLFPRVKDVTLATMMRAAREKRRIDLGRFTDAELQPINEKIQALNLKTSREPVSR